MFRPVSNKVDFAKMEEGVLSFWRENDVFKKSVENRPKLAASEVCITGEVREQSLIAK